MTIKGLRWWIIGLIGLSTVINYIDRSAINIMWPYIYKEFGIGTGFGLRFDFSFLILRFDVGIKAYDPAYEKGNRFVLNRASFFKPYATETGVDTFSNYKEPVTYNIGIGYPF